jgi:hypothetical protein
VPDPVAQLARKFYAISVTQTDAYVGTVLAELDALGMEQNTIVVVRAISRLHFIYALIGARIGVLQRSVSNAFLFCCSDDLLYCFSFGYRVICV